MKKRTGIIIVIILLLIFLLGINGTLLAMRIGGGSVSKTERLLAKGQDLLEDGKYDEAVQIYKEVLETDTKNVEAY